MSTFAQSIAQTGDLTEDQQKKAGQAVVGDIDEEHKQFLRTLKALLERGEIDPYEPKTFLKSDVYDSLDESWQDKTDLALQNIALQVRHIHEFLENKDTPNESPQLQTMVEQLWQMKQSIEEEHDVFKF